MFNFQCVNNFFSPTQINQLINQILEENFIGSVRIKGEITNLSRSNLGHLYFSLKDSEGGLIGCVFWKSLVYSFKNNKNFTEFFKEGSEIICTGKLSNYNGRIQLSAHSFEVLNKEGALFLEFEKTKKKLSELGLFDASRKKTLPKFPKKICVITSAHGAVIQDMINRVKSRFPIEINLLPASVQGKSSTPKIIKSINFANQNNEKFQFDLLILARGGGSFEELSIFNDENLVKALANSKIPTISAIGHETDFTLADFAADLRAPTPSAAIEICLKVKSEIENQILGLTAKIHRSVFNALKSKQNHLRLISKAFSPNFFLSKLERQKTKVRMISEKIQSKIQSKMEKTCAKLEKLRLSSEKFDHKQILKRGYSLCWLESHNILIKSSKDFEKQNKSELKLEFFDGLSDLL